jgi:hypothetical protein
MFPRPAVWILLLHAGFLRGQGTDGIHMFSFLFTKIARLFFMFLLRY